MSQLLEEISEKEDRAESSEREVDLKIPMPGDKIPEFSCSALVCGVELHNYGFRELIGGNKFLILLFYPADFTYACPTEVVALHELRNAFLSFSCSVAGSSPNTPSEHRSWLCTRREQRGIGLSDAACTELVLLSDRSSEMCKRFGIMDPEDSLPYRGTFLIDKSQQVLHTSVNDKSIGRSISDLLNIVKAFYEGSS